MPGTEGRTCLKCGHSRYPLGGEWGPLLWKCSTCHTYNKPPEEKEVVGKERRTCQHCGAQRIPESGKWGPYPWYCPSCGKYTDPPEEKKMDAKSLMEILVEEGALNPLAVKIIDNMENANEAAISELNRKIMGLMAQVNDKEKIITALQKKVDGLDNQVHNLNNRDLYPEDFPPGPVSEETARYIGYREFIEAIRTYRTLTGLGLKDAKDWVEQMAPRLRIAGKEPQGKYSNPNSVYYFKVDEGMDT